MKMYVNDMDELTSYERQNNAISYDRLIKKISNDICLFNKAPELTNYDFDFIVGNDYDEETDEYIYDEVYQYYLIDIDNYTLDLLQKLQPNGLYIAYSETLGEYVLMVTHYGTSWDYVLTDIEPTTDYKEADL